MLADAHISRLGYLCCIISKLHPRAFENACLHLIVWWVWLWLCSNILFLTKESQVTHVKR